MNPSITGLHHVTAIASDPRGAANLLAERYQPVARTAEGVIYCRNDYCVLAHHSPKGNRSVWPKMNLPVGISALQRADRWIGAPPRFILLCES